MARFLHVCSCLSAPVLLIHGFSNDEAGQPKKKAKGFDGGLPAGKARFLRGATGGSGKTTLIRGLCGLLNARSLLPIHAP